MEIKRKQQPKWIMKTILFFSFIFNLHTMNVYAQNSLSAKQQSIVSIAALTAVGDLDQLKTQLNLGFENTLTLNETKEILVQSYAYCGVPRSLNAISTFIALMKEREEKGLATNLGKSASVINKDVETYERGRKTLEALTQTPQSRPAAGFGEFAPRADQFLKEHLFADIFDNDVLTYQERELATIGILASFVGVEPQLKAHIDMGKNTGITQEQLVEVAQTIESLVSRTQANSFRKLIQVEELPLIDKNMLVRISEIEIEPTFLEEYNAILEHEAKASVELERGVIAIFPMQIKEQPTHIRIIEIYKNQEAYKSHIASPHFQHYKTSTLKMVKDLKLIDMSALDEETMLHIFKKLK